MTIDFLAHLQGLLLLRTQFREVKRKWPPEDWEDTISAVQLCAINCEIEKTLRHIDISEILELL